MEPPELDLPVIVEELPDTGRGRKSFFHELQVSIMWQDTCSVQISYEHTSGVCVMFHHIISCIKCLG